MKNDFEDFGSADAKLLQSLLPQVLVGGPNRGALGIQDDNWESLLKLRRDEHVGVVVCRLIQIDEAGARTIGVVFKILDAQAKTFLIRPDLRDKQINAGCCLFGTSLNHCVLADLNPGGVLRLPQLSKMLYLPHAPSLLVEFDGVLHWLVKRPEY